MKTMNDDSLNHDWEKAIKICKNLDGFSNQEAVTKIQSLKLSDSITAKAINIISRIKETNNLLDKNNATEILNKIHNNNSNDLIDKTIDSYRIIELIAKGGMSSVFKAQKVQTGAHKPVALKILSPYVFSDKSVELFNREQLILSQLKHPNIVSFHHSGKTTDGTKYLVMEYVDDAQTITSYCQAHNFTIKQIILIIQKLTKVFVYAHNNLIIHRDIKPSNILIDNQGTINVIDFGIAQMITKHDKTSTQVYTKNSASPEQILGHNVSIQTDVFSLGAVLLELLVNKNPLPETNITNYNPQNDVIHIKQLLKNSSLDSDLQNIIHTAMHIDTSKRYATMETFSQDLNNWLSKRPVKATSDSKLYKLKKFVIRNPLPVSLGTMIFISMFVSIVIVNNYATKANKEAEKTKATLSLITQIFNPADSWDPTDPSMSLQQALDDFSESKLPSLELDKEIKINVHKTLGEIYINFGLFKKAQVQLNSALSLFPKNKIKNNETAIIIQSYVGITLSALGHSSQASKVLRESYNNLMAYFPENYNLRLQILTGLMDSYYSYSYYASDDAQSVEQEMLEIINSGKVDNLLKVSSAYDALSVKAQFQDEKDFKLAKKYLQQASVVVNIPKYKDSIEYYNLQRTLAILEMRMGNYQQGGEILSALINKISTNNPNNSSLNRLYEDYSTALFKTNKYNQSIKALSQSIDIANHSQSQAWLYKPLSKRAMYHIRLNNFKLGLLDQLELISITVKYKKNKIASSLYNLALILYSIGYTDIGRQLVVHSIDKVDKDNNNYNAIVEYYYLVSGIINWHAKNIKAAEADLVNSIEYKGEKTSIYRKILNQLLYPNKTDIIDHSDNLKLSTNLLILMQANSSLSQLNLQQIQKYCAIPKDYENMKVIAIKELFLSSCKLHYLNLGFELPNTIDNKINTISAAKTMALQIPQSEIKLKLKEFIN